jgi:hypothetical protein
MAKRYSPLSWSKYSMMAAPGVKQETRIKTDRKRKTWAKRGNAQVPMSRFKRQTGGVLEMAGG